MNLRDLSYLLALARLKNFSEAAAYCHVSQPTLSMQIRKLEESLGCQLFERHRQQLLITHAGERALAYAQQIHNLTADMKQHFKQLANPMQGEIKFALFPTLAPYLLPKITPLLKKQLPELTLLLHELISEQCVAQLEAGKIDIILIANELNNPQLHGKKLWTEPFHLASSKQHRLKKHNTLSAKQLPIDELILLDQGHCLRDQGLEYCMRIQQSPQLNYQATSLETLLAMVELDEGVTFIPEIALTQLKKYNIKSYAINHPPTRSIYMYWRASMQQTEIIDKLQQVITQAVQKQSIKP